MTVENVTEKESDYSELLSVLEALESSEEDLVSPESDEDVSLELGVEDDVDFSTDEEEEYSDTLEVSDPPEETVAYELSEDDHIKEFKGDSTDELSLVLLDLPSEILSGKSSEETEDEGSEEDDTPKTWESHGAHSDFLNYLVRKLKSIPAHSGQTTVGCEKAVSYLRKLDREISKAIQSDDDNIIDELEAEKIRDTIHDFIDKLEEAYDFLTKKKRKKKASFRLGKRIVARLDGEGDIFYASVSGDSMDEMLVPVDVVEPTDEQMATFASAKNNKIKKEAAFATFMDPFLEAITRLLMRAHITHGKDLRDVYGQLDSQYKFTDRERLSIHEILRQAGLGLNVDLGRINEKDVNIFDGKNVEFSTTYPA
jgi:hypothetical protein